MTDVELLISSTPVDYPAAVAFMEARVAAIHDGTAREAVWFLEHPPLFTAGTSAKAEGHLGTLPFPVYEAGRGGEHTYHGPGQRVAYLMLDVGSRGKDIRAFVSAVEAWVREALGEFSLMPRTYPNRVGLWVDKGQSEAKIAAIGIRLKRWVSLHGVAINVSPDLAHFGGIIPCGITQFGVTSLEDLGLPVTMADLDVALIKHFAAAFAAPLTTPQSLNI